MSDSVNKLNMTEEDAGPSNPGGPGKRVRYINQRPLEVDADSEVYNMSRKVRKAVIFNHYSFIHDGLKSRRGTEYDVKRLETVLTLFNFTVTVHQDLTRTELRNKLEKLSRDNHDACDCLAIFVLTHGKLNKLAAKDNYYYPEELWSNFSSVDCRTMAGKPKLIIVNACRGEECDSGTEFVSDLTTDGPQDTEDTYQVVYNLPNNADILVAFSTFEGYVSHRKPDKGTWFIQALCDVLTDDRYKTMEIKQLLTRVTHKVALHMTGGRSTQVPVVMSSLIRDLYLS